MQITSALEFYDIGILSDFELEIEKIFDFSSAHLVESSDE